MQNQREEQTIEALDDKIRQSEQESDALLQERVRLERGLDDDAELIIARHLEHQAELWDLDEEYTDLLDEAGNLQDRVEQQSEEAAEAQDLRSQEIVSLLMSLEDIEVGRLSS